MQEDNRPYWTEEDTEAKKLWQDKEERDSKREDRERINGYCRQLFKKGGWRAV